MLVVFGNHYQQFILENLQTFVPFVVEPTMT